MGTFSKESRIASKIKNVKITLLSNLQVNKLLFKHLAAHSNHSDEGPISLASLLFSLKTFGAATLTLYLAFLCDLPKPSWSLLTVYIISTPLIGVSQSKGFYRIIGTLCGAFFSLLVVPPFVNAPEILMFIIALWVAGCLYLSLYDGTPRAYSFNLAGYTAAIIVFSTVNVPNDIFQIAVARTEEIILGIICVYIVNTIPFGKKAGATLEEGINNWFKDARSWNIEILKGDFEFQSLKVGKLVSDLMNLDVLRLHAHYDTPELRRAEDLIVKLQRHMQMLFTHLSAIEGIQEMLRQNEQIIRHIIKPVITSYIQWLNEKESATNVKALIQKHKIMVSEIHQSPVMLLTYEFLLRVEMCLDEWKLAVETFQEIKQKSKRQLRSLPLFSSTYRQIIWQRYFTGIPKITELLSKKNKLTTRVFKQQDVLEKAADPFQYALSGLAVFLSLLGCATFWIMTGWPEGGGACIMVAVICSFFASLDTPPTNALNFIYGNLFGTVIGGIYLFAIFPQIDGFPLLIIVFAFVYIPIGILQAIPSLSNKAIPLAAGITSSIGIGEQFSADVVAFVNSSIAQILGMGISASILICMYNASSLKSIVRLLENNARELEEALKGTFVFSVSSLDRIIHRISTIVVRSPSFPPDKRYLLIKTILLDLQLFQDLRHLCYLQNTLSQVEKKEISILLVKLSKLIGSRDSSLTTISDSYIDSCFKNISKFSQSIKVGNVMSPTTELPILFNSISRTIKRMQDAAALYIAKL